MAQPEPTLSSLAAKVAAHASWKNTENRTARTAEARAAALAKFEREVDPDGKLSVAERRTRAEHARREHLARISLRSAKMRKLRAQLQAENKALAEEIEQLGGSRPNVDQRSRDRIEDLGLIGDDHTEIGVGTAMYGDVAGGGPRTAGNHTSMQTGTGTGAQGVMQAGVAPPGRLPALRANAEMRK